MPTERGADAIVLDVGAEAETRSQWLKTMWEHRAVTYVLARQDFHVRYKRASLGVLWALAVPALQVTVLVLVFSHIVHVHSGVPYGAFVLSGVLGWTYFVTTLPTACTAIVDGSALTDKVWFPRAILALVPCLSGLVGLAIAMAMLLVGAPILGAHLSLDVLLLIPACGLLVAITTAFGLLSSALQVYFRDVRFIVTAAMMVWMYATPIMYPQEDLGHLRHWLDINPMTGVVTLFHLAILGQTASGESWHLPVAISVVVTLLAGLAGIEAQRRRDRVFVDLL